MSEYSALIGDAVLRQRTRLAEDRARIEIELANRIKSEFVSNMSHELRTPLNTVIGFAKLLSEHDRRRISDRDVTQYAELIRDAAGHLLAVINDILDISKMRSGHYTLEAEEINLGEILHRAIADNRSAAESAGLSLRDRIGYSLPAVRGDAVKLRQVFSNLLSNAIKFTRPGGEVLVETAAHSDGGTVITVHDTGIGMTDEEIKVALSLFGQVAGGRDRWREGTGLGLPISKALIELHGGDLDLVSEKGRGTQATVVLPPPHKVSHTDGRIALLTMRT